jgi:hypothetical protein
MPHSAMLDYSRLASTPPHVLDQARQMFASHSLACPHSN